MKKDAYYFSHDSNAKDDPKCMLLIDQLGLEGYGIFWVLIEILRDQPEYKYPIDLIPIIARRYNTSAEKMIIVVRNFGLFEIDENNFFSRSLVERMMDLQEKKLRRSIAGKKGNEIRWNENRLIAMRSQCDSNAIAEQSHLIASKVKKSKVNESKVKKKKEFIKPSISEVIEYFKENGYSESSAKVAFNFYDVADWHDSKGNKVRNWKQKMQAVWFKSENLAKPEIENIRNKFVC